MLETINLDDGLTTAGQSLAPFGSLFTQSGILRPNSFTVSALGSPGMFVEVSGSDDDDIAIIKRDDGATYFIRNTLDLQVPITANSSGVTKTDAIVLYIDLTGGDDENAGSPGAAQAIAVRRGGVSTGLPNDGEIDAETGNNPWIFLKEVEVEHDTGEIESEDLSGTPDRAYVDFDLFDPTSVIPANGSVSNAKLKTGSGEPGGAADTWTPTFSASGSMSVGTPVVTRATYKRVGRMIHFQLGATFTTTGSGSTDVRFTLPVPIATNTTASAFHGVIQDTALVTAAAFWSSSSSTGVVRRYDGANWGIGTTRSVFISGTYEAAS